MGICKSLPSNEDLATLYGSNSVTRMNQDKASNVAASVRQRLLNIIRETGDDANLVWTRYAAERLLYRLCVSEYTGGFILKGTMLFLAWAGRSHRPTVDVDFLGYGKNSKYLSDV
jgi:hypothetical protein